MVRNSYLHVGKSGMANQHDPYQLYYDVVSQRTQRHLYTIPLMNVHDSEHQLRGGRFELFTHDEQPNSVTIEMPSSGEWFRHNFREMVEWIANHAFGPWSFDVTAEAVGKTHIRFSFADLVTGVAFKMVWV